MYEISLLLESKDVPASNGGTFDRLNPVTGDIASRAAAAQIADAKRAADTAAAAFPGWSATGPNARRAILLKAADLLASKAPQFVELMAAETGATAGWAGFNVHLAAGMLREAAAMTTQISGEVIPSDKPGCIAMAVRQPAGVVLSMAPWNAPVILGVRAIALPLACGNTVVLKASEICPGTHRLIAECLRDAGLPPGVLNVITNAPEDAPALIEMLIGHPAVRRVNFTGSTRVGRIIAQVAAKYLKPALLELGGKAPMIVLDDADIDAAVAAAAFGAFMNQGQICMSTERLVVDEKVADAFVAKLATKAGSLVAGDPRKGNTPLGSLIGTDAATRIHALINDAVSKGAKVVAGGRSEGTLMSATVIDGVNSSMRIYGEESFGPVVCVVRVNGADEAVRVANDTEYGLSAAVFGRDIARAFEIAKRIDSGICHVNGPTVHDEAQMPFGGVKATGYGRFGGKAGIAEFTELRWITIETGPQNYPIYPTLVARASEATPVAVATNRRLSLFGRHRPRMSLRSPGLRLGRARQLLCLTRKITGSVKLSPSSATNGGGIGTGSERRTIASAASSKAGSPEPFSISVESTWPIRSSVKRTWISADFCCRSFG
jgi:acyl-CoA reductase-like NAD-dependent aldehyde dehydrogenase